MARFVFGFTKTAIMLLNGRDKGPKGTRCGYGWVGAAGSGGLLAVPVTGKMGRRERGRSADIGLGAVVAIRGLWSDGGDYVKREMEEMERGRPGLTGVYGGSPRSGGLTGSQ
ncbi:hypothetical protein HAX54_044153 [Datura stramonium]|uniref:Uncharacterized protein n=1 Tax=Datura stramonium TaxID=4076 RepID=A0ABS8RP16_DATST|nr:hypothetical protein [Datura stramonium]